MGIPTKALVTKTSHEPILGSKLKDAKDQFVNFFILLLVADASSLMPATPAARSTTSVPGHPVEQVPRMVHELILHLHLHILQPKADILVPAL